MKMVLSQCRLPPIGWSLKCCSPQRCRLAKAGVSGWFVRTISAGLGTPTVNSLFEASLAKQVLCDMFHSLRDSGLLERLQVSGAHVVQSALISSASPEADSGNLRLPVRILGPCIFYTLRVPFS